MRIIKKTLILIMAVILAVSTFFDTNVKADTIGTENVRKVVSVVYDNSSSMYNGEEGKPRYLYAAYALQMLSGLLNEDDKMIITPMNSANGNNWKTEGIEVDLSCDNTDPNKRNEVINNLFYNPNDTNQVDVPGKVPIVTSGNTPYGSVEKAMEAFKNITDGKGIPTSEQYSDEDKNTEYWLIILTDGIFNGYTSKTKEDLSNDLTSLLKDYGHLNTIYYAFGDLNQIFDLKNTSITEQLSFTAYSAVDGDDIIKNMQDIANKLSRRFALENDYITYDGNKVIVDLNQYSSNAIAFKSLSIIAQNSGVKLKTVKYNGVDITSSIIRPCVLGSLGIADMKDGYLGLLEMNEVFSGGTIELEFSGVSSSSSSSSKHKHPWEKDDDAKSELEGKINILVEPALSIQPYFTYQNQAIDMEFVNSTLKPGDKIKVDYKIVNPIDGSEITNLSMFGDPKAKITYTGPGLLQGQNYNAGEQLTLAAGRNTINLEVVFGEKYTLLTSVLCVVEVNPTIYRIDGDVLSSTNQVDFKIFHEDNQKTKDDIKNYKVSVVIKNPSGNEITYNDIFSTSKISINDSGDIVVNVDVGANEYGKYEITCKVVFSEIDRIVRTNKQYILNMPKTVEVKSSPEFMTIGEFNLPANQNKIIFGVYGDGNLMNIDSDLFDYKLEIGGVDVTSKAVVKRNQGTVEFIPNTSTLPDAGIGDKEIKLIITRKDNNQTITGICNLTVEPTRYEIKLLTTEQQNIDIYKTKECDVEFRFKVYRNDISLTYTELFDFYEDGSLEVDTKTGWLALSYGLDVSFEIVNGEPEVVCKVQKDWMSFLAIDKIGASFIFGNEKEITLSYEGVSATGIIKLGDVTMFSRIGKWLLLLLYIAIIVHFAIYGLGFVILKPFPKGIIITFKLSSLGNTSISLQRVNFNKSDIRKWHLYRLIPFKELTPQKPIKFGDSGKLIMLDAQPKVLFNKESYKVKLSIPHDSNGTELRQYIHSLKTKGTGTKPKISSDIIKTYVVGTLDLVKASTKGKNKIKNKKQRLLASTAGIAGWENVYVIQGNDFINGGKTVKSFASFIPVNKKVKSKK